MYNIVRAKQVEKKGYSQQQLKYNNTMLLFNLIRRNGEVFKKELSKMTGLSATTVSQLTEDLLATGLIVEIGEGDTQKRGRKPIMLKTNDRGGFFVVIELLSKGFICSLYGLLAEQIDCKKYKITQTDISITQAIQDILKTNKVSLGELLKIGIMYPGIIDFKEKKLVSSTALDVSGYFPAEELNRMKALFEASKIHFINTSVAAMYYEYSKYPGICNKTICEIAFDEGVGGAILRIGKKGECLFYHSAEVGHVVIDSNGPRCKCGNQGCFEAVCGVVAAIKKVSKDANLNLDYDEEYGAEKNEAATRIIVEQRELKNPQVLASLEEITRMMETLIFNVINTSAIDGMFLSGLVVDMIGKENVESILNSIREKRKFCANSACEIIISDLGYEAKRKGLVYHMMDEIFAEN